jgi:hypothetical protein
VAALHALSANLGQRYYKTLEFLNKSAFHGPEIGCVDQIVLINWRSFIVLLIDGVSINRTGVIYLVDIFDQLIPGVFLIKLLLHLRRWYVELRGYKNRHGLSFYSDW